MVVLRSEAIGIDAIIQRIQNRLESEFNFDNSLIYPRCYINERSGKEVPEHLTADNEYKEVLYDDSNNAIFYFITDNVSEYVNGYLFQEVTLYCAIDLFRINLNSNRNDEEINIKIVNLLKQVTNENEIKINKGNDRFKRKNLKNMQPYLFMDYTFTVKYTPCLKS